MTKSHDKLLENVEPSVRKAARAEAVELIARMSLAELRKARGQSQAKLAEAMELAQPNISQIENRPDALVSTLRQYVEALGGELEIHARFPDGQNVVIRAFD